MSRHLVDPELLPALDAFPPSQFDDAGLAARREMLSSMLLARESYAPDGLVIEDHRAPGPAGAPEVPIILYRPDAEARLPLYLHIHGGGYVFGNAEMCGPQNVATARGAGCIVASVDYRLAPEVHAPGNVEDCYAALCWLHAHADALGIDAERIAVGGESAGGGLAAALALIARDRAAVPIRFQMLLSPMLDDRTAVAPDVDTGVGTFVWTRESNAFGWRSLLGHEPGLAAVSAYCAAARAEDLAGLPPTYLAVGALDLFRDEGVEYARLLLRAGVPTELHVIPGAYHGFERAADAAITRAAHAERHAVLRRALHAPPAQ